MTTDSIAHRRSDTPIPTAIVYCDGFFGEQEGKTANGLVRHSQAYRILSVIDRTQAGRDAGERLDGVPVGIPIVADLASALATAGEPVDMLICGVAPADGLLDDAQRAVLLEGLTAGLHLVNGLHQFLSDDLEFAAAALLAGTTIIDIRRPKPTHELRLFSGDIETVGCPRVAVLGTDGAIGKRTTATLLVDALAERGVHAVLVGTGQTTIIQGGTYGVALDAMIPQFASGEVEHQVVRAWRAEHPDVIIVEGQGALSHPAYLSSGAILRGSRATGVIVQHAPHRAVLSDFPFVPMPTVESEIALIEAFAPTRVIGIAINHEHMSADDVDSVITDYEERFAVPVTDPLTHPLGRLADMVLEAFPSIANGAHRPADPVTMLQS